MAEEKEICFNLQSATIQFAFGTDVPVNTKQLMLTIECTGFLNNQLASSATAPTETLLALIASWQNATQNSMSPTTHLHEAQ